MRVKDIAIKMILKNTYVKVIQEKIENGTLVFTIKLLDTKKKDIDFYKQTMEMNVNKTVEGLAFIYCRIKKKENNNIISFIIGINSITGMIEQIRDRIKLAIGYFLVYDTIDVNFSINYIKNKAELLTEFADYQSVDGSTNTFYSMNREENLDLIANVQEILFLRQLMTFSIHNYMNFPGLTARHKIDECSVINLINIYLYINNYYIHDKKIYVKQANANADSGNYFDELYFIEKNFFFILCALKKKFPGQLNNLNVESLVHEWGNKVLLLLHRKQSSLTNKFNECILTR